MAFENGCVDFCKRTDLPPPRGSTLFVISELERKTGEDNTNFDAAMLARLIPYANGLVPLVMKSISKRQIVAAASLYNYVNQLIVKGGYKNPHFDPFISQAGRMTLLEYEFPNSFDLLSALMSATPGETLRLKDEYAKRVKMEVAFGVPFEDGGYGIVGLTEEQGREAKRKLKGSGYTYF